MTSLEYMNQFARFLLPKINKNDFFICLSYYCYLYLFHLYSPLNMVAENKNLTIYLFFVCSLVRSFIHLIFQSVSKIGF